MADVRGETDNAQEENIDNFIKKIYNIIERRVYCMNDFYVYGYIRLDTNTYFYIGKGHSNRWLRLDNRKKHFLNILNVQKMKAI